MTTPARTANSTPRAALLTRRRSFVLLAGAIGAFVFLLNLLTPLVADDWGRAAGAWSFRRVLTNSWAFYLDWDGRLINTVLGNSTFLVPGFVFDVANAAMFVALMLVIYAIAAPRGARSLSLLLLVFVLTWIYLPGFGQVALWQLGSVIYLWATVQMFVIIWLFQRYVARGDEVRLAPVPRGALLLVLGLVAGNAAQNGSGGALLVLTGYVVATRVRQGKIPAWMIAGWVGTALGLAAVVLAPGNSTRQENLGAGPLSLRGFLDQVNSLLGRQYEEMGGLLIIVAVLLVAYLSMQRREWHIVLTASLFIGAGFATTLVMLAAPSSATSLRVFIFSAIFFVAAAAVLVAGLVESIGRPAVVLRRALAVGLGVVAVYSAVPAAHDAYAMWSAERARMAWVVEQRDAGRADLAVNTLPPPQSKYRADYLLGDVLPDPTYWRNQAFSQYMKINSVIARD